MSSHKFQYVAEVAECNTLETPREGLMLVFCYHNNVVTNFLRDKT